MRKLFLMLLAAGVTVMLAGHVFAEDPPNRILDQPRDSKIQTMRLKVGDEPGPIELPISPPGPIVKPLNLPDTQFLGAGLDRSGGALPSTGGRGSMSADPILVTERRIKKIIGLLED